MNNQELDDRLKPCCLASLRVFCCKLSVTTMDLRLLGLKPVFNIDLLMEKSRELDQQIPKDERVALKAMHMEYPLEAENILANFKSAPQGTGRKAQLTLMTVDQALDGFDESDLKFCNTNVGWYEFSVASVILWKHVIDPEIAQLLEEFGLFTLPLRNWKDLLKAWCNDVRRYNGIGLDDFEVDAIAASTIRKLTNLSGRDLKPADFAEEAESMLAWKSCKLYPSRGKMMSTNAWFKKLGTTMDSLVKLIEPTIMERVRMNTLRDWWSQRRQWCPSGSSSERVRLNQYKMDDPKLISSDRPNKMQVAEDLSYRELLDHLCGKAISRGRASTKPEPGFKYRALYAGDDWSTHIASYASADFEKHISIGGMVAKQTPEDIIEWLAADKLRSNDPQRIWLSLDYANFNKEHSKIALSMLNFRLCRMWLRGIDVHHSPDIMISKAFCALWTGLSHQNAYVHIEPEECVRHFSGLWSGHRDTARDNTMLHWCYSNMMRDAVMQTMDLPVHVHYMGMCGDDEDGLHDDWVSMSAYIGMHSVCQLNLNPVKQLADWYCHEFLQRQANKGTFPARPIAPMIATLSTGSWYKMSHTYYDTVVESLCSNCREIIARGANACIMRRVIAAMINRMMTVSINEINIPLEWWRYRHGSSGLDGPQSIWCGTGNCLETPSLDKQQQLLGSGMPTKGVDDWITNKRRWLVGIESKNIARYRYELRHETYKAFYGHWRQMRRDEEALLKFGVRKTEVTGTFLRELEDKQVFLLNKQLKPNALQAIYIWNSIDASMAIRRPMTEEVLLDILGLDPRLLRLMGGWRGFYAKAKHRERALWQYPVETQQVVIPLWMSLLDPALLSWWKHRNEVEV